MLCIIFSLALAFDSCSGKRDEAPVIPPATSPLSRPVIGFGVVNMSYTHVAAEPVEGAAVSGYLRRGSLVSIIERRSVRNGQKIETWVLAEGSSTGWLRETVVDIYDNELQAQTASEAMNR
ncbi:MAG: hypothetical protein LBH97_00675 [Treponema sp.]|jgi:hypothetical protein|nr:hypothetical protein [Treponema sp.]